MFVLSLVKLGIFFVALSSILIVAADLEIIPTVIFLISIGYLSIFLFKVYQIYLVLILTEEKKEDYASVKGIMTREFFRIRNLKMLPVPLLLLVFVTYNDPLMGFVFAPPVVTITLFLCIEYMLCTTSITSLEIGVGEEKQK
ncbi:hypothetical protein K9M47_02880 [Candidatus Gracilibacteria bacterium]|nr:hypothetical protein [Candidatus Gracilibacteria bacterium]